MPVKIMTIPTAAPANQSFGGILLPFEMFRPSALADALGQALVGRARNVLDAELVLTRHVELPLLCVRIEGSVVGEQEGEFWLEGAELAMYASMAVPRQAFLYFRAALPERREGFVIAQRGKALGADEASESSLGPDAPEAEWPLARLCAQLRIPIAQLAAGFAGGPSVRIPLLEPAASQDEIHLRTLAGELIGEDPEEDELGGPEPALGGGVSLDGQYASHSSSPPTHLSAEASPAGQPVPASAAAAQAARPPSAAAIAQADTARRAAEHAAEQDERAALAAQVNAALRYEIDDLGVVVAPTLELSDSDLLQRYVARELGRELPPGLPQSLSSELQGKRCDFVVVVEFLSEVFVQGSPLVKAAFERDAESLELNGVTLKRMAAHAPRLGLGTVYRANGLNVFISRAPEISQPSALIVSLLVSR